MIIERSKNAQKTAYDLRMTNVCHAYDKSYGRRLTIKVNRSAILPRLKRLAKLAAVALALIGPVSAVSAAGQKIDIGNIYHCPSPEGLPPVSAWVGKVDKLTLPQQVGGSNSVFLVHLQLVATGDDGHPNVFHAPFLAEALAPCVDNKVGQDTKKRKTFNDGYRQWKANLKKKQAGFFQNNPAEAYWIGIGVLKKNGTK